MREWHRLSAQASCLRQVRTRRSSEQPRGARNAPNAITSVSGAAHAPPGSTSTPSANWKASSASALRSRASRVSQSFITNTPTTTLSRVPHSGQRLSATRRPSASSQTRSSCKSLESQSRHLISGSKGDHPGCHGRGTLPRGSLSASHGPGAKGLTRARLGRSSPILACSFHACLIRSGFPSLIAKARPALPPTWRERTSRARASAFAQPRTAGRVSRRRDMPSLRLSSPRAFAKSRHQS